MHDLAAIRSHFPKAVPVFPLPDTVLFPGALLPLHIFEPRYRAMVDDAMASDSLLAMGLLTQCTRDEYRERPPFHERVCVGQILRREQLAGGRSNILLLGVSVGLATAREDGLAYRTADVTLEEDLADLTPVDDPLLWKAFLGSSPGTEDVEELRSHLANLVPHRDLGAAMVGACAVSAKVAALSKLELLGERSVQKRLEKLVELIERPWQWN